jgi:8-oxo-dGTP pyrophosphatase MutT (NUDIX family)
VRVREAKKRNRFAEWVRSGPGDGEEPVEAATVILVRDGDAGIETLMLRRNSKLAFVGGMWVFPGGRVDLEDREGLEPDDTLGAARRAAVREAREEADLVLDEASLVPFSHWTPPSVSPRRFLTWFFIAPAPPGEVSIDRGEILDHAWMRPGDAIRRRDQLEIELAPPTWVSLDRLSGYSGAQEALQDARDRDPQVFATRIVLVEGGAAALWEGDAGYEDGESARPGRRHRLSMLDSGWRYERSD